MTRQNPIPVIDLFAGPGGLGEGFSSIVDGRGSPRFAVKVSIEKDAVAHRTLSLRALFRAFPKGAAHDYSHGRRPRDQQALPTIVDRSLTARVPTDPTHS